MAPVADDAGPCESMNRTERPAPLLGRRRGRSPAPSRGRFVPSVFCSLITVQSSHPTPDGARLGRQADAVAYKGSSCGGMTASPHAPHQSEHGYGGGRRGPRGQRVRDVTAQFRSQDVDEPEQHDSPQKAGGGRCRPGAVARPEPLHEPHADKGRNGQIWLTKSCGRTVPQAAATSTASLQNKGRFTCAARRWLSRPDGVRAIGIRTPP